MSVSAEQITRLLNLSAGGDRQAEATLLEIVYAELRRLAAGQIKAERQGHTLQPTALVNEAYFRLFDAPHRTWTNRAHFFAFAARVMRNILVDHARRRQARRHGGGLARAPLAQIAAPQLPSYEELIGLDEALNRLAAWDPRQAQIVELRFFAGLTEEEIASLLEIGTRTVKRDWAVAKAWLFKELNAAL